MLLDSATPNISEPFSPEVVKTLQSLEKKRKLAENKMLIWLIVPILWTIPFLLQWITGWNWLFAAGIAWAIASVFGVGVYVQIVLLSNTEVTRKYKKTIIPDLLRMAGAEGEFSLSHGLKVDAFLKSGLYHEKYSHFERLDCIIGKYNNVKFGLYELAVQVATTLGGQMAMGTGMMMPQSSLLTNMFYGWVLHVPIRSLAGNTYIIPSNRKTKSESDDWTKATSEFFVKSKNFQTYKTGNPNFDNDYIVYTTNISEAEKILSLEFQSFLILVLSQSANAPGFSFVGNRAAMHLGISDSGFDRQVGQVIYPPDADKLLKQIRFFCAISLSLHSAAEN